MFKGKNAELGLSVLVVIILALVVIIFGIFLLNKILAPVYSLDKNIEKTIIGAVVYPSSGIAGTIFNIQAHGKPDFSRIIAKIDSQTIVLYDDGKHGDEKSRDGIYGNVFDSKNSSIGKISGEIYAYEGDKVYKGYFSLNVADNLCVSLMNNGGSDKKVDIVFIGADYTDSIDFKEDISKYADFNGVNDGLFSYTPFRENKDKFNVDYLDNLYSLKDLGCIIGCKGVDSLVCCNDKKVFQIASQCSFDQIVILINNDSFCASSSSYAKICTKGRYNSPMTLVHEFGHSFGGLGDEYDYSDYANFNKIENYNYPNCASNCSGWPNNVEAGCFGGCGYSEFYRSAEKNSIMYGYSDVFNPVCRYYLNNNLDFYDPGVQENLPAPEAMKYILEFNYSNGKFNLEKGFVVPGESPDRNNIQSGYNVLLRDFSGNVIYSSYFNVGNVINPFFSQAAVAKPAPFIEPELTYSLILPYSDYGRNVEIYKNNIMLTSADMAYLSNRCGNGICESTEDYEKCSKDCKQNSDLICSPYKDEVCDKNCSFFSDFDCYKPLVAGFFISLIALISLIIFFAKKKK